MPVSAYALTQEQAFLRAVNTDGLVRRAWKSTVGTALTTTACVAAIFETIVSGLAAFVFTPVLYAVGSKRRYDLVNYTRDSASTVVAAARRTFGAELLAAANLEEPSKSAPLSKVEQLKIRASDLFQQALSTGKAHKGQLLGTAAVAAIVATAYYADVFGMAYNLVAATKEVVPPHYVIGNQCFLNTTAQKAATKVVGSSPDNSDYSVAQTVAKTVVLALGSAFVAVFVGGTIQE
jgi:hypothetical protein